MISFGHTAFGAIIGTVTYNAFAHTDPVLGLAVDAGVNFIAHYVEDFIPHGHFFKPKYFKKRIAYVIFFDLALSIMIFLAKAYIDFGISLQFTYIFTGIFFSQLPDMVNGIAKIGLFKNNTFFGAEDHIHNLVHWHGIGNRVLLLNFLDLWQLVIIIFAFFFI